MASVTLLGARRAARLQRQEAAERTPARWPFPLLWPDSETGNRRRRILLLLIYGTIHAAIWGGPVMPDDMWWLSKILLLILLPSGPFNKAEGQDTTPHRACGERPAYERIGATGCSGKARAPRCWTWRFKSAGTTSTIGSKTLCASVALSRAVRLRPPVRFSYASLTGYLILFNAGSSRGIGLQQNVDLPNFFSSA